MFAIKVRTSSGPMWLYCADRIDFRLTASVSNALQFTSYAAAVRYAWNRNIRLDYDVEQVK